MPPPEEEDVEEKIMQFCYAFADRLENRRKALDSGCVAHQICLAVEKIAMAVGDTLGAD